MVTMRMRSKEATIDRGITRVHQHIMLVAKLSFHSTLFNDVCD